MTERERVLVSVARRSTAYRSAIVSALDLPVARQLASDGLVRRGPFEDWFTPTEAGVEAARAIVRQAGNSDA